MFHRTFRGSIACRLSTVTLRVVSIHRLSRRELCTKVQRFVGHLESFRAQMMLGYQAATKARSTFSLMNVTHSFVRMHSSTKCSTSMIALLFQFRVLMRIGYCVINLWNIGDALFYLLQVSRRLQRLNLKGLTVYI